MDIKRDRDQVLYYYKNLKELETEGITTKLQIRTNTLQCDPVRICPRSDEGGSEIWHILLLNTNNRAKDLETLKSALGRFGREFREEL